MGQRFAQGQNLASADHVSEHPTATLSQIALASAIGTTVEYYDFTLYDRNGAGLQPDLLRQ
jgi:hypothetical protein